MTTSDICFVDSQQRHAYAYASSLKPTPSRIMTSSIPKRSAGDGLTYFFRTRSKAAKYHNKSSKTNPSIQQQSNMQIIPSKDQTPRLPIQSKNNLSNLGNLPSIPEERAGDGLHHIPLAGGKGMENTQPGKPTKSIIKISLMKYFIILIVGLFSMKSNSVYANGPDLIVSSLDAIVYNTNYLRYNYQITNIGDQAASLEGETLESFDNVKIQAFISTDTIIGNADDMPTGGSILGLSPIADLLAGEFIEGSFTSNTTIDPSQDSYLALVIDWGNDLQECNEDNNVTFQVLQSESCDRPNLIIEELELTNNTGSSISLGYTLLNNGSQPANLNGPTDENFDNVSIQAFFSEDPILSPNQDQAGGGTIVGISPIQEIEPGERFNGSFTSGVSFDSVATPFVMLMIDWGGSLSECNELDNIATHQFGTLSSSEESNIIQPIKIYPNPASDLIHIDAKHVIQDVSIVNNQGKVVLTASEISPIDVSHLTSGIYTIILTSALGSQTQSINIQ